MRILHLISSMNPVNGGVCQALRSLIPETEKFEHRNEVVCLDDPNSDYLSDGESYIFALGQSRGPWAFHRELQPWLSVNLQRYDAVIVHGLWQYGSYAITKIMRGLAEPKGSNELPRIFVMPHGMLDPWFQLDPTRRFKAWRNWAYWKLIEHRTIARADGMLFTCRKELQLAREQFRPFQPKAELIVGLGVEPPPDFRGIMATAFQEACPSLSGRSYLLFLSRIHPKKGVDLLIDAYAQLAKEADAADDFPALVIAGPTDSDYAKAMQQLSASHQLLRRSEESQNGPGIIFSGMLQGDAKWGAFYGCDAFVLPSHQENFGIAVVEALACGKLVLISDKVNIFSDIEADGAAFSERDTPAGTEALLRAWLTTSMEERQAMNARALACYRKRYLPASAAEKFLKAIQHD